MQSQLSYVTITSKLLDVAHTHVVIACIEELISNIFINSQSNAVSYFQLSLGISC